MCPRERTVKEGAETEPKVASGSIPRSWGILASFGLQNSPALRRLGRDAAPGGPLRNVQVVPALYCAQQSADRRGHSAPE
jgi:hypothetical protein